jgi:hypothetical protein
METELPLTPAQERFHELKIIGGFKSDVDVANFLGIDNSTVSKYLSRSADPSKRRDPPDRTLDRFRDKLILAGKLDRGSGALVLNESHQSEVEELRERAEQAEKKLAEVRRGLRRLLAQADDPPPVHGVSSDVSDALQSSAGVAASTEATELRERPRSYRAGEPSGGKRKP